jgi:hypothetical protein
MATMTKLFEKVVANDYEWFESLVQSKKEVNWDCIRCKVSLVYKAIEVRAVKTFNILMNIPELTVFSNSSGFINGINKAVDYYIAAPNADNKYFLDRLLEKNVVINSNTFIQCINNIELAEKLFNNLDKKEIDIRCILENIIRTNNIYMLNYIYNYIITTNPSYYINEKKEQFNNMMFAFALLYSKNVEIIQFFINLGVNWKYTANEQLPTLYYCIKHNMTFYDTIFSMYKQLSSEELNNIPNIKNIIPLITSYTKGNDMYKNIFSLPINFTDMAPTIINIFTKIYQNYYGNSSNTEEYKLIYICFYEGKVKSNPLMLLDNIISNIVQYKDYINKNSHITNKETYKKSIRNFLYINEHFNYTVPEKHKHVFEWLYQPNVNINEKEDFIKELTYIPPPVVPKKKNTKKKNTKVNTEMEV